MLSPEGDSVGRITNHFLTRKNKAGWYCYRTH